MINLQTITCLKMGMTRDEVISVIGKPDTMGFTNRYERKNDCPSVWKYEDLELWFESNKNGKLIRLWDSRINKFIDWA
jgi:hypothetical protein